MKAVLFTVVVMVTCVFSQDNDKHYLQLEKLRGSIADHKADILQFASTITLDIDISGTILLAKEAEIITCELRSAASQLYLIEAIDINNGNSIKKITHVKTELTIIKEDLNSAHMRTINICLGALDYQFVQIVGSDLKKDIRKGEELLGKIIFEMDSLLNKVNTLH